MSDRSCLGSIWTEAIHAAVNGEFADAPALEHLLSQLNSALEESPAPEYEWDRVASILGIDLLATLVGISPISVRRYKAAARSTPDEVAARLHLLAVIVRDLSGAYNDMGVHQRFGRKRVQHGGQALSEIFTDPWEPKDPAPIQVHDLARAQTGVPR